MEKYLLALLLVVTFPASILADTYDSPFVAGFDRFFRETNEQPLSGGRLLISELSCAACHAAADPDLQPKRGPNLAGAGRRYQLDWLRRYLLDPQAVKAGTTMPDVMHHLTVSQKQQAAEAIAAFLSAQDADYPILESTASNPIADKFWTKGNHDRGAELYHQVGCVACHEPNETYQAAPRESSDLEKLLAQLEPDEIEDLGLSDAVRRVRSVPHGDLANKYSLKSLTYFLYAPQRTHPAGRMPSLNLKPHEAADIAAYLIGDKVKPSADQEPERSDESSLVESGRRLFTQLRCVQCHAVEQSRPTIVAKPLADLNPDAAQTCIEKRRDGIPFYGLDANQVSSIQSALNAIGDRSIVETPVDTSMIKLNCYACHKRNQHGGVGPNRRRYFETIGQVDIGDEGRLPPPLDGVGRKLRPVALVDALHAKINLRPHMTIRMPKFAPQSIATLPNDFIQADAPKESSPAVFPGDTSGLANSGRMLFDTGCVQCHPVGGEHLPGVVGIDVAGADQRLHPQWFHDFLLSPGELKARTRMPTFFPGGRSANTEILGGDAERQIAALWAYIEDIPNQPLPQKIADGKAHDFELIPDQRPILIRTFMKDAGTHAIAVGFSSKVHYAFDAEAVRPAQLWRGRFLDAHGTWFDRFTPPATPLSEDVINFPPGVAFATLPSGDAPWPKSDKSTIQFSGLRIDRSGVPTFLYRIAGFEIEDQLTPDDQGGLNRSIKVTRREPLAADPSELWFRGNAGKTIQRQSRQSYRNQDALIVTVSGPLGNRGLLREANGIHDWVLPIQTDREVSFEVNYRW